MIGGSRRIPFLGLSLAAAAGILLADWLHLPWMPAALFTLAGGAVALAWRRSAVTYGVVLMVFLVAHTLRHFESPARKLAELHRGERVLVRGAGMVVSEPRIFVDEDGDLETSFRLALLDLDRAEVKPEAVHVLVRWREGTARRGDLLQFAGSLGEIASARNPGQFDFGAYQKRRGVYSALLLRAAGDAVKTGERPGAFWQRWTDRTRSWMQRTLTAGIADDTEVSAVIQSMALGFKSEIPEKIRERFEQTGTLHVFVVSGLHVGLLGLIVIWILTAFGLSRRTSAILLLPMIWFYAALAHFSPGSVRATVMGSVVLAGLICRRPALTWNSFFAAFFLLLAWDSEQLFLPGFQFSFGVVGSILLLAGWFHAIFQRVGAPDPFLPRSLWRWTDRLRHQASGKVAGLVSASISAWIGSIFFTAKYFHLISPSAVLANLLVVPMAALILTEVVFSLLAGTFSTGLAVLFNHANWALVKALLCGVEFFAGLPGGYRYVEMPTWGARPEIEVVSFDLGAGGATAVWVAGETWLIDCGGAGAYRNIVRPYLRSRGINRLSGFVVSHGDSQHLGGGAELLRDFRPRRVVTSTVEDRSPTRRELLRRLRLSGMTEERLAAGDRLTLGDGTTWRVLSPPPDKPARLADDSALVLQLRAGGHRVLFSSDIGFAPELALQDNPELRSDVLIKGLHRTDFSGTPDFLRAVHARIVVEADRAPFGEMPTTPLTAVAIAATGGRLFRQSETGAVRVRLWRDRTEVETFLPEHRFVSRSP